MATWPIPYPWSTHINWRPRITLINTGHNCTLASCPALSGHLWAFLGVCVLLPSRSWRCLSQHCCLGFGLSISPCFAQKGAVSRGPIGTVCHHWSIGDYITNNFTSTLFQVSGFSWSNGCSGKMAKGLHLASPSSQAFRKLGEADSNILAQLKPSSSTGSMGSTWMPPTRTKCCCCTVAANALWLRSQPLLQFGSAVVEAFVEEEEQHLHPLLLPLPHAHVNT